MPCIVQNWTVKTVLVPVFNGPERMFQILLGFGSSFRRPNKNRAAQTCWQWCVITSTFFSFPPSIPRTLLRPCSILNKLTPEKFDKLCLELLNVGVDSKLVLKGIILLVSSLSSIVVFLPNGWQVYNDTPRPLPSAQIVDKALEEPKYSSLYAQLCLRLAEDAPNFDGSSSEIQSSQKQSTVSVPPTPTKLLGLLSSLPAT